MITKVIVEKRESFEVIEIDTDVYEATVDITDAILDEIKSDMDEGDCLEYLIEDWVSDNMEELPLNWERVNSYSTSYGSFRSDMIEEPSYSILSVVETGD